MERAEKQREKTAKRLERKSTDSPAEEELLVPLDGPLPLELD